MESVLGTSNVKAEDLLTKIADYIKTSNFWISLAILVVAIILWQVLKQVRKRFFAREGHQPSTASHVAFDILRFVFIFGVIIALMQLNGINVTGMITGLGIISIIVGLALQDFLKDIIMGAHILTDKFFEVGDVVRYTTPEGKTVEGEVISFNVRTTKIRLVTCYEVMTISNRNISEIMVLSELFDLDIDIPYSIPAAKVHPVMQKIAESVRKFDGVKNASYKGTCRFNPSSISYKLRYWTSPKASRFDISRSIHMEIQNTFREEGIPFAHDHLDVEFVGPAKDSKDFS